MADTTIDDNSTHEIAKWRRQGHGVWYFRFVVDGYHESLVMREPGRLGERFAKTLAAGKLARTLRVKRNHVVHEQTVKEM